MSDIAKARLAFPLATESIGEFVSKPFVRSDDHNLYEWAKDDPMANWERRFMPEEHYSKIASFRVSHYERYSFGVLGLWQHQGHVEHLVGQWGLQVFDPIKDEVEAVVFLSREFVGRGIGSFLFRAILERSANAGLVTVLGVVREDNAVALRLMQRLGGVEKGRATHFGFPSIIYRFSLDN